MMQEMCGFYSWSFDGDGDGDGDYPNLLPRTGYKLVLIYTLNPTKNVLYVKHNKIE